MSKKLATAALTAAMAVAVLYLSSILPTASLALAALAGIFHAAVVLEAGYWYALGSFVVSAFLGFLLLPDKGAAISYAIFLGYYPILKSVFERISVHWVGWILKLILCSLSLGGLYALSGIFTTVLTDSVPLWILLPGGCAVFVLYDLGLTKLITYYLQHIHKMLNKR